MVLWREGERETPVHMNFQNRREKEARGCLRDGHRCHITHRSPGKGASTGAGTPQETNRKCSIDVAVLSMMAEDSALGWIWKQRSQVGHGFTLL